MTGDDHIRAADYVNERQPPDARAAAERHLVGCRRCRAEVEALRRQSAGDEAGGMLRTLRRFGCGLLRGELALFAPLLSRLSLSQRSPPAEDGNPEPLRVLTPRVLGGMRGVFSFVGRFGLVLLLTVGVLLLPAPPGLPAAGHRALAAFVFTAGILALEPVSLPIAALMVPVALVALGTADTHQAFETFSRPVVFLILASLFLAEALRKHGLTRRLALRTIVASGGGVGPLLLGLMGIAGFFAMWVESTSTVAMLVPVAMTIAKQLEQPEDSRSLLVLLVLGIAYGASLGGMVTILGSAANAVAFGFLSQVGNWTFLDWMKYGFPSFLLLFPLTWWLLLKLAPVPVRRLDLEPVRQQLAEISRMSRTEREILLMLGVAVVFWVGGPYLEALLGLSPTLLSSAMVAVMAVSYLAVREIITWEDVKGVSWGIFLIIGAGLSLGETLTRTGVTGWFAELLGPLVAGTPLLSAMLMLVFLSALLTNLLNNTTIAAVFVPILITMAGNEPSLTAAQLVLPVTLATTFGYSLPSASGRMALVAATGIVERRTMLRCGLLMTGVSSLVLALLFYTMARLGWI